MPVNNVISSSTAATDPVYGNTTFIGYSSALATAGPVGGMGTIVPNNVGTEDIIAVGIDYVSSSAFMLLMLFPSAPSNFFNLMQVQETGQPITTFTSASAIFYAPGVTSVKGFPSPKTPGPMWTWGIDPAQATNYFSTGTLTTLFLSGNQVPPTPPAGNGDITDPEAWQDNFGNIPPIQFSNVPYNVNYPLNGDGRYWFSANAYSTNTSGPITFIGNPNYALTGNANLQWSVVGTANDGSGLLLAYNIAGTWTTTTLLPQTQLAGIQNGQIAFPLSGEPFQIQVYAQGGTPLSTASLSQVAVAITRNFTEGVTWDGFVNPFDPVNYNALAIDNNIPTDTMSDLQSRILVRLGFANQASNPPPGMAALVQDFLMSAQTFLYKRYMQLHTKRFFRWKVNPGQRFYSLKDNDENVLEGVTMDPNKTIEWCGIQDSRNVWYPMIQGIPPQLYTMITKPWRPARYELRGAIEIYPVPDQTYWLWVRAHFGLMSFVNPSDTTTIDSELVFLWALANAKAHYGQPDAQNIAGQANAYKAELIAASHQTAHYLPGTIAVPPAVRPTLIQFDANSGGGS